MNHQLFHWSGHCGQSICILLKPVITKKRCNFYISWYADFLINNYWSIPNLNEKVLLLLLSEYHFFNSFPLPKCSPLFHLTMMEVICCCFVSILFKNKSKQSLIKVLIFIKNMPLIPWIEISKISKLISSGRIICNLVWPVMTVSQIKDFPEISTVIHLSKKWSFFFVLLS